MGIDHNDDIWYASMYTDVIGKLDPKTGKVTEYPFALMASAVRETCLRILREESGTALNHIKGGLCPPASGITKVDCAKVIFLQT